MDPYFTGIFGSPRLKPVIVEEMLAAHDLDRGRAMFIGDATTDYDAAEATGMAFLGRVSPGNHDPFPPGTNTVADLSLPVLYVEAPTTNTMELSWLWPQAYQEDFDFVMASTEALTNTFTVQAASIDTDGDTMFIDITADTVMDLNFYRILISIR